MEIPDIVADAATSFVENLTKEKVIGTAKTFRFFGSTDINKYLWIVEVEGKLYPARQLMLRVKDLAPNASMNSYQAVDELKRMGFKVFYKGKLN